VLAESAAYFQQSLPVGRMYGAVGAWSDVHEKIGVQSASYGDQIHDFVGVQVTGLLVVDPPAGLADTVTIQTLLHRRVDFGRFAFEVLRPEWFVLSFPAP
jgi:hypothetical protein